MEKSLKEKNIEMLSIGNQRKSIAERFIRASNNQIYICKPAIAKNAYFYKLDNNVSDYDDSVHSTLEVKPKY